MTTENTHDTEWLSALADDELEGRELQRGIDALLRDPALRQRWASYHATGEAMRGDLALELGSRLPQRISAALEQEPTVLAPRRSTRTRGWLKHAAGLAVAASVTGMAIIGIQQLNQEVPGSPAPAALAGQPEVENIARLEPPAPSERVRNDHLAPYLVNHNEYSSSTNMQGMLPYVRIVGHGPSQ